LILIVLCLVLIGVPGARKQIGKGPEAVEIWTSVTTDGLKKYLRKFSPKPGNKARLVSYQMTGKTFPGASLVPELLRIANAPYVEFLKFQVRGATDSQWSLDCRSEKHPHEVKASNKIHNPNYRVPFPPEIAFNDGRRKTARHWDDEDDPRMQEPSHEKQYGSMPLRDVNDCENNSGGNLNTEHTGECTIARHLLRLTMVAVEIAMKGHQLTTLTSGSDVASSTTNRAWMQPKGKRKRIDGQPDDNLTFEQKRNLSETIQFLDAAKIEKVVQIISKGMPEMRDVRACILACP